MFAADTRHSDNNRIIISGSNTDQRRELRKVKASMLIVYNRILESGLPKQTDYVGRGNFREHDPDRRRSLS